MIFLYSIEEPSWKFAVNPRGGAFYIGLSQCPQRRFREHLRNKEHLLWMCEHLIEPRFFVITAVEDFSRGNPEVMLQDRLRTAGFLLLNDSRDEIINPSKSGYRGSLVSKVILDAKFFNLNTCIENYVSSVTERLDSGLGPLFTG